MVENPTGEPVLLFEGEEVLGAQQNRTFDVSVLVARRRQAARAGELHGGGPLGRRAATREDIRRRAADRLPAHAPDEGACRSASGVAAGLEPRAIQGEVWDEVAAKSARHGADSPTGAMHDIYEDRRGRLARDVGRDRAPPTARSARSPRSAARSACLDYVSRPDVYAALHGASSRATRSTRSSRGGAGSDAAPTETARAASPCWRDCEPRSPQPGIGLGEELRFAANGVAGSGLVHEGELIQLTAFPGDELEWDRVRPQV